jgi:hypothetical protein
MPCQPPNPIEASPRIKRWGAQLEKHKAYFTVRSLLFATALFVLSGYALASWLLGHQDMRLAQAVPIIHMGNIGLIFMTLYFVLVEYLFRRRPQEVRLVQRFIWYLAILVIITLTGVGAILVAR